MTGGKLAKLAALLVPARRTSMNSTTRKVLEMALAEAERSVENAKSELALARHVLNEAHTRIAAAVERVTDLKVTLAASSDSKH